MSDLKNWFNLQQSIRTGSSPCRTLSFLDHTALGILWRRILQERNIPPPSSWLFGGSTQNFIYCFYKCYTIPPQFSTTALAQGMAIVVLYPQPPQNDPPRLLLQAHGPHMDQFAELRPKSVNGNTTNQSEKKIALSACLVTKNRAANRKRVQISQLRYGLLSNAAKMQVLGSHPFSFKHNQKPLYATVLRTKSRTVKISN